MGIPLDEFREQIAQDQDDPARIVICHGPPRCSRTDGSVCQWCYEVHSDDERSTEQIMADMKRGDS